MVSDASEVFANVLAACRRLQQEFPRDDCLASIIGQFEEWIALLADQQQGKRIETGQSRWRADPRSIRPMNEDVARMVQAAFAEAGRLGLSLSSA